LRTLVIALSGLSPAVLGAQGDLKIALGQMVVEIGMSETHVVKLAAAKGHRLTAPRGFDDTALVWASDKIEDDTPVLGQITFSRGRVKTVYKRWMSEPASSDVDVGNGKRSTDCVLIPTA
ncbi:MAG TPA: hypothetical protein VF653_21430, partial [Methylomirabilota bacterium]